jgi:hypothetical protein
MNMVMKTLRLTILSIVVLLASCQDVLEDEYKNPEQYAGSPDGILSGMFTGMIYQWKFYVKDYGEWWWQMGGNGIANYSQVAHRYITARYPWYADYDDLENGAGFTDVAVRDWFNDYYVRLKNWGAIRDNVALLEGDELKNAQIYYELATIMKDWAALRNVDLFNSIPYFDAFKGSEGVFVAKYDDPKEIYISILAELKDIADRLPGVYAQMSAEAKNTLINQDIALHGDITKWVQYTNAIRLRAAVRLAGVDEAVAKEHIEDILATAQSLPQADLTWSLPVVEHPSGGGLWLRGLYERNFVTHIPVVIMDRMNFGAQTYNEGVDDPRLPVIAMPTKYRDYRGVSMNSDAQTPGYIAGDRYYAFADNLTASLEQNSKSLYNHVTYAHNKFPAYMMSLAEVDLLLAEVALKGLGTTGKTAGEHMNDAVVNSTNFWYYINSLSAYASDLADAQFKALMRPVKPAAGVIADYAQVVQDNFDAQASEEDKMEVLMQQKYIHINLIEPYDLFTDLRRTRHPKLEPMTFGGKVMRPTPERCRYPQSEFETNTENYLLVRDQDNFTSPIFWVPVDKRSESYYQE